MHPIIMELIRDGVSVYVSCRDGRLIYDLETGMKSNCVVSEQEDGSLVADMRYGETAKIESLDDLVHAVRSCLHGRRYMSSQWGAYFEKLGYNFDDLYD